MEIPYSCLNAQIHSPPRNAGFATPFLDSGTGDDALQCVFSRVTGPPPEASRPWSMQAVGASRLCGLSLAPARCCADRCAPAEQRGRTRRGNGLDEPRASVGLTDLPWAVNTPASEQRSVPDLRMRDCSAVALDHRLVNRRRITLLLQSAPVLKIKRECPPAWLADDTGFRACRNTAVRAEQCGRGGLPRPHGRQQSDSGPPDTPHIRPRKPGPPRSPACRRPARAPPSEE